MGGVPVSHAGFSPDRPALLSCSGFCIFPLWFLLSVFLSFLMTFLVNYCIGMTGFWLTRTDGLRMMFGVIRDVFAGVFIPLNFFPVPIQKIFFFLPFQFITYVPIRVFIGSYELAGLSLSVPRIVGVQACAVAVMLTAAECLGRISMRKFSGVGA